MGRGLVDPGAQEALVGLALLSWNLPPEGASLVYILASSSTSLLEAETIDTEPLSPCLGGACVLRPLSTPWPSTCAGLSPPSPGSKCYWMSPQSHSPPPKPEPPGAEAKYPGFLLQQSSGSWAW